jgi:hypothetical protein
MWDKVRRLSSWEEARDRAREAQLLFLTQLSQQQPGAAELLRHVVRLAEEAIVVAANGAEEEEGAAAVEIRLLDRAVPAPPIPSSDDGSASASGSGGSPLSSFSSRDGPAPARLPPVRSLRMVAEGGGGSGGGSGEASPPLLLLPPLSLAPALDVPRAPEMAHDCYFNFLRHVLALVSGHPFFR